MVAMPEDAIANANFLLIVLSQGYSCKFSSYREKIRTRDSNTKPFDLISAISSKIKGVSAIRIQILVPHPEMHLVPPFWHSCSCKFRSRKGGAVLSSGKVTGFSKVRIQILVPYPQKHQ
ncbi:hypothetical protein TNCV_2846391 [Trichonephila clavipes]|nr:hypothetical protein TNCV_2846391 [Trichonephila clavipes]